MNKKLLSSRRNTRENLLMLFYSREFLQRDFRMSADEAVSFLRSIKDFKTDENVELIRDSIKEVFDNVRITKLDPEDIIEFPVPCLKEKISMTFHEMDEENVCDGFFRISAGLANSIASSKPEENTVNIAEENRDNLNFFTEYVNLYFINLDLIDTEIKKNLENWDFGRISIIDKIILRMGIVELKFLTDIPSKVTINEAIELGKKYSTEKSNVFINGILNKLKNILRESSGSESENPSNSNGKGI